MSNYTEDQIMNMSDEEAEAALAEMNSADEVEEDDSTPVDEGEEVTTDDSEDSTEPDEGEEEEDQTTQDGDAETAITEQDTDLDSDKESDDKPDSELKQEEQDPLAALKGKVLPLDIPVNGVKVNATLDELVEGFKKGMNYTKKMQELSQYRKTVNAMRENNVSEDDINLFIEAKSGNKQAIAKLLKTAGVDALDIDVDDDQVAAYRPQSYGQEPINEELEQVKSMINSDTEYVEPVKRALNSIDDDLYQIVSSDPRALQGLYTDVKNGVFEVVYPEVMKMKNIQGRQESTLQLYQEVTRRLAEQYQAQQQGNVAQENAETISKKNSMADKRKNAAISKTKSTGKTSVVDYDALNEDDFDKEYERIMGRARNSI